MSSKLAEEYPVKEIILEVQKMAAKASIPEHEVVILVSEIADSLSCRLSSLPGVMMVVCNGVSNDVECFRFGLWSCLTPNGIKKKNY